MTLSISSNTKIIWAIFYWLIQLLQVIIVDSAICNNWINQFSTNQFSTLLKITKLMNKFKPRPGAGCKREPARRGRGPPLNGRKWRTARCASLKAGRDDRGRGDRGQGGRLGGAKRVGGARRGGAGGWFRLGKGASVQFSSVQWLSRVRLFATPWTAARQASLSITNSRSLLKLMSIESVMPSNHRILCRPLLLPSIFPSIRVLFASSGQSIGVSASASVLPMNTQDWSHLCKTIGKRYWWLRVVSFRL